ncbi:MAG: hypothetical protein AAGA37_22445 [Actinomycetota bacterium]
MLARRERGSIHLLFPAAFLVMIVLGAIVIDVGLSQVRARELEAVASSAANDALGALDLDALRENGEVRFDVAHAERIVQQAVANGALTDAVVLDVALSTNGLGEPQIDVTLQLQVEFVIAPALPGGLDSTTITRTRSASVLG